MSKLEIKCAYCGITFIEETDYYSMYGNTKHKCPKCGSTDNESKKKLTIDYQDIYGYNKSWKDDKK